MGLNWRSHVNCAAEDQRKSRDSGARRRGLLLVCDPHPAAPGHRLRVLQTVGLTGFVTMNGTPIPVPEKQIEGVQLLLSNNLACRTYAFIKVGNAFDSAGAASTGWKGCWFLRTRITA